MNTEGLSHGALPPPCRWRGKSAEIWQRNAAAYYVYSLDQVFTAHCSY